MAYTLAYPGNSAALTAANRARMGLGSGSSSTDAATGDVFGRLSAIAQANNVWSASQAAQQMDYQTASQRRTMQYNADQAALNRRWQEYMSNTAHQREVRDLMAAGLNPVLSVTGGSGAPVTSGASASASSQQGSRGDTDMSLTGALVNLLSTALQTQASVANTATSAAAQRDVAETYGQYGISQSLIGASSAREVAGINAQSAQAVAKIHASATLGAAQINSLATQAAAAIHRDATLGAARYNASAGVISSAIHAAASKYGTDVSAMTQRDLAAFNRDLQLELQQRGFDQSLILQHDRQSHELKLTVLDDTLQGLFGLGKQALANNGQLRSSFARMLPYLLG